jgi:hypothetical protein
VAEKATEASWILPKTVMIMIGFNDSLHCSYFSGKRHKNNVTFTRKINYGINDDNDLILCCQKFRRILSEM